MSAPGRRSPTPTRDRGTAPGPGRAPLPGSGSPPTARLSIVRPGGRTTWPQHRQHPRRQEANQPTGGLDHIAQQILGIADTLTQILDQAAARSLAIPPSISNSVHDLRGWAHRINQGTAATRPAVVDATRVLVYLRGLPDHQVMALLADLPWARLDALLDAVNATAPPSHPRSPRS